MRAVPVHVVASHAPHHGVTLLARQLAEALGAATVDLDEVDRLPLGRPVHVHFVDRLVGATPAEAADRLAALARRRRTTLTLHDVPQPTDGAAYERRRDCYARVLGAVHGWVTSSRTEHATVHRHCAPRLPGAVVPLPVVPGTRLDLAPDRDPATLGVFGWVYPGKGHRLAVEAAAQLGDVPGGRPTVVALGAVASGHDDLVPVLRREAEAVGVGFEVTGWLDDASAAERLARTTVGLVAHANLSASGSLNSWLSAGRRPLVREGDYTREMLALRPGSLDLFPADATAAQVAALVRPRLAEPALGRLDPAGLRPTLAETAEAYHRWWAS